MSSIDAVTDDHLDLTTKVDLDTYMEVLAARSAAVSADPRFPALLHWMVRAADDPLVITPEEPLREPSPRRQPRPRRTVDVAELIARRDRLYAEQQQLGQPLSDDPAATRLRPRDARRAQTRMDRHLERYTQLGAKIARLDQRIRAAQTRQENGS